MGRGAREKPDVAVRKKVILSRRKCILEGNHNGGKEDEEGTKVRCGEKSSERGKELTGAKERVIR